jgi:hypothetical protein
MDDGWYLSMAPVISANFEAGGGDRWVVPVGGGIGWIFKIGQQHINASMRGHYNVEDTPGSGDWTFQASWTFLFPKNL